MALRAMAVRSFGGAVSSSLSGVAQPAAAAHAMHASARAPRLCNRPTAVERIPRTLDSPSTIHDPTVSGPRGAAARHLTQGPRPGTRVGDGLRQHRDPGPRPRLPRLSSTGRMCAMRCRRAWGRTFAPPCLISIARTMWRAIIVRGRGQELLGGRRLRSVGGSDERRSRREPPSDARFLSLVPQHSRPAGAHDRSGARARDRRWTLLRARLRHPHRGRRHQARAHVRSGGPASRNGGHVPHAARGWGMRARPS